MKNNALSQNANALDHLSLGKETAYSPYYDAALLQGVPRALNRDELNLKADSLPFSGCDLWNLYELSWLNIKGNPMVATGVVQVPHDSEYLIESKSFKLYLNSFNQTKFQSTDDLIARLTKDLTHCAGKKVSVIVNADVDSFEDSLGCFSGVCIDHQDIEIDEYTFNQNLLHAVSTGEIVT